MEFSNTENLIRFASIVPKFQQDLQALIEAKAGEFFNNLYLDEEIGNMISSSQSLLELGEEDLRTLVQCVPGSMKQNVRSQEMPIHFACGSPSTVTFVPILAEEGLKHDIGGEGMRGGVLCKNDDGEGCNVLELISFNHEKKGGAGEDEGGVYQGVLQRLREMGLFMKEDIKNYDLLYAHMCYCCEGGKERFDYLADWDPSALRLSNECGCRCPLDTSIYSNDAFMTVLNSTLFHYPQELGLLLLNDTYDNIGTLAPGFGIGRTPMASARKVRGKQESWKIIKGCLNKANSTQIFEIDKRTNMYPFMLAAAGESSELDLLYYLVLRNPHALVLAEFEEECQDRKRKR